MHTADQGRIYTPQLSAQSSAAVRRLAWAMGKPMTKAVEIMVRLMPANVDPGKACLACQDTSGCGACIFRNQPTAEEKAALLAF
jgi:hypothetical protein